MKLLYRMFFFLLAVFYVNISEAKTVLYCEVIALEFVATGALIYGALELGSYMFTGKTVEDHIFEK